MIASKNQIALIAGSLFLLGLGLTLYKAISLGFPLLPGEYQEVWTIESKISFTPRKDQPLQVDLELPVEQAGWVLLEEHFASSGFGFTIVDENGAREARWTRQSLDRSTTLYYKMQVYRPTDTGLGDMPVPPISKPMLENDQLAATERLIALLREQSASTESFVALLVAEFNKDSQDRDAQFLLGTFEESPMVVMRAVLAYAGIPAHEVRGIRLEDGRRRQTLSSLLEFHDGDHWVVIDPETANLGLPANFFVWQRGNGAVLGVAGGSNSTLQFALVSNSLPAKTVIGMEQRSHEYALLDFSIYALPVEQQGVFKVLMLIPVAALVVVIMRLLVGLSTSGTFMPILIALAFLQTQLVTGLLLFLTLVGTGLWIRSWLSHMNLLLVSRISAVIIVVIFMMATTAILSYKFGLDRALTVTFFPTIILAWTIERMSILWEEEGFEEVFKQGGGSLLVAVLSYLVMTNRVVEHLTFNFPELTLSLLAVILLLGKYTGYRLSELYRFRDLDKPA
ncbi:MAG: inactive transglutaminase family protein [Pseudomonadales bacterium]|nr:inactive transglutaminase family protein [Pseudomonadales bacterium]